MILRIGICDDEHNITDELSNHIMRYEITKNIDFETKCFSSGNELIKSHEENAFNIILLDIEMPSQSGLDVARYLREEALDDVCIVFVTGYPSYMLQSFEVQPFQFLTKPVSYNDIEKLIDAVIHHYKRSHTTLFVINDNNEDLIIRLRDVYYIEAVKDRKACVNYYLSNSCLTGQGRISELEQQLTSHDFLSPSRGTLVNVRHIHSFTNTHLLLDNNVKLPISRRRIKDIQSYYAKHIIHLIK